MARTLEEITEDFANISARAFNLYNEDANGLELLHIWTDELLQLNQPQEAAEVILRCIERLSSSDEIDPRFDLGTPGPMVHTLESLPNYEDHLVVSLIRQPTPLTVWMLNRIINMTSSELERRPWLQLMYDCLNHPACSEVTRQEAQRFLDYQLGQKPDR